MPRGRKKKEVTEVLQTVGTRNKSNVVSSDAMRDQLEKSVLKEYAHLFSTMPDRRDNLFKLDIPGFNYILGGGLPRGQIIHIYGPEGTGKTTLAMHIMASIQKQGGRVYCLDSENSMDCNVAKNIGVNVDEVRYLKEMPNGETALDIGEKAIRANLCDCLIFDSVAALVPEAVKEGSNLDKHIGDKARMISQGLDKLNNATVNSNAVIVFVNQLRANISKMPNARQWITPGGKALPFYANVNIHVSRVAPLKEGEKVIGQQVKLKVEKNKIAPPMREVICNLIFGQGFRKDMDLILSAKDAGIIKQKGSWIEYNGESIGQGLNSAVEYAKTHENFLQELEDKLYGDIPVATEPETVASEANNSSEVQKPESGDISADA
jgi:recombination protein RecA